MPVMKQLRIGSETYDTVGEASVTQVQTSGTKIATVTIDGTATDLYAPEGGSSVDPASAAPLMDGTAAVGTSTDYARADHVHPTDTSRQETLVSGTNIKTINSTSLLGSGNMSMVSGITFGDPHDTYAVPVNGGTAHIDLGDGLSASDRNNKVTISADVPSAGSTAPKMDGTAAVGTSTSYARADHVHPTDTSRAAASHTHAIADVTNLQSTLDGKQPTLVSGTSIKTINGESILGSGDLSVGGGGSYDYRIDVTVSGSTVTADYNGSTLTEIANAITSDPATNVLAIVLDGPVGGTNFPVKASVLYAAYDADWGDMASMVTLLSFEYDSSDDRLYARRTQLAGFGNSTQTYRIS